MQKAVELISARQAKSRQQERELRNVQNEQSGAAEPEKIPKRPATVACMHMTAPKKLWMMGQEKTTCPNWLLFKC